MSLGGIEHRLDIVSALRITLHISSERIERLVIILGIEYLLGTAEQHRLLVGIGLVETGYALDISQIAFRLLLSLVNRLDRQQSILRELAARHLLHHLLVVSEGVVVILAIPGVHSKPDQGAGDKGRIAGRRNNCPVTFVRSGFVLSGNIGTAELIHRLSPERIRRRGLPRTGKHFDLGRILSGKAIGNSRLIDRIERLRAVSDSETVSGDGVVVFSIHEQAVSPADRRIGTVETVAGLEIGIEPSGGLVIFVFLEVSVGNAV